MRTLLPLAALLCLFALPACGEKKGPETAADTGTGTGGGFVDISMEDTEEDLEGTELMRAVAPCGDLLKLEPAAMMGKLTDPQIRCLDDTLRAADKQTTKDKLSRVLMADAWAKGDANRWEAIVRRHLNDIDRSDADLCFKFAKYLSEKGAQYSDETLHWAEVALDNRHAWTGDTHVSRVNSLFKIRAYASAQKWQSLEEKYAREPSEELLGQKDIARNQAKTLAREWLEYAKQAGKDPTMALQMCVSAAGTEEFCAD